MLTCRCSCSLCVTRMCSGSSRARRDAFMPQTHRHVPVSPFADNGEYFAALIVTPLGLVQALSITNAPTRYGVVSLSLNVTDASASSCAFSARITWHLHGRGYVDKSRGLDMVVRLRDHTAQRSLDAEGARVSGGCSGTYVPENRDAVTVTLGESPASEGSCLVCARLKDP